MRKPVETHPLVVHCRKSHYDVYIGRPGPWGNPWSHLPASAAQFKVTSVQEAVARHKEWFLSQPEMLARARRELKGKILGCWCAPNKPCHGVILAEVANGQE